MKKIFLLFLLLTVPLPALAAQINLPVPFLREIPDGVWTPPWSGACEEASASMAEQYYLGNKQLQYTAPQAKKIIWPLFGIENKLFGYNSDTNAKEIAQLINDYMSFDAVIKNNPTLTEIKNELNAGHPILSLHLGYDLKNPLHRFRRGASSFHAMVITGFDDATNEFLVNDAELKNGLDFRYNYDIILNSLHDFNHTTKKADGPPTVIFTSPKQIVRATGGQHIYVIHSGQKYLILNPAAFVAHRWPWSLIKTLSKAELATWPLAGTIGN